MSKEIGPREKALREMREAKQAELLIRASKLDREVLQEKIKVAAKKRSKPRKAKAKK